MKMNLILPIKGKNHQTIQTVFLKKIQLYAIYNFKYKDRLNIKQKKIYYVNSNMRKLGL